MYKKVHGIYPERMNDVFQVRNNTPFNLIFFTGPIFVITIWAQIPNDVKLKNSLVRFKKEIRK